MGYHPRIETKAYGSFITTRSRCSELWFVNNSTLEYTILGYLAKFVERYDVRLYACAIAGNHIHLLADFPKLNRASFMRDFNSCVARAISSHCQTYPGGRFWGRRYSNEFVPKGGNDMHSRFCYTVLQAVQDGLVERTAEYPGYNCFHDAVRGIKKKFEVVRWAEYNQAKRYNKNVKAKDFTDIVHLHYSRLPGDELLSKEEYLKKMEEKLEEKRLAAIKEREKEGLFSFAGKKALLRTVPGDRPVKTKTSRIDTFRPRILSECPEANATGLDWYWGDVKNYRCKSKKYRAGDLTVKFPDGMYKPYLPLANADPPKEAEKSETKKEETPLK